MNRKELVSVTITDPLSTYELFKIPAGRPGSDARDAAIDLIGAHFELFRDDNPLKEDTTENFTQKIKLSEEVTAIIKYYNGELSPPDFIKNEDVGIYLQTVLQDVDVPKWSGADLLMSDAITKLGRVVQTINAVRSDTYAKATDLTGFNDSLWELYDNLYARGINEAYVVLNAYNGRSIISLEGVTSINWERATAYWNEVNNPPF